MTWRQPTKGGGIARHGGRDGDVRIQVVIDSEPGVRDVAEDVLREKRRREGEQRDRRADRAPEHASRKRSGAGDNPEVAEERHEEKGKEVDTVEAQPLPVGTQQPAWVATDSRRYQAGPRERERDRA